MGCTVEGKSASIDSNSRIPFFGLELRERERKSSGPPIHSIRAEDSSELRIDSLGLLKGKGAFSRLGEIWDRRATSLPTYSLPVATEKREVSGRDDAALDIDFRE
jgi:hypothetical protein